MTILLTYWRQASSFAVLAMAASILGMPTSAAPYKSGCGKVGCSDTVWQAPCEGCETYPTYPMDAPSMEGTPYYDDSEPGTTPTPLESTPRDTFGLDSDSQGMGLTDQSSSLPSGLGAVAAASSPSVHMIGDFFGSAYFLGVPGDSASIPSAGGDRRFKATDNLSPVPQDRVFFNYHHFHNAVIDIDGEDVGVNRFTFGFEKTFFEEMISTELRIPFVAGLNSNQVGGAADTLATEFGNVSFTIKARLLQRGRLTFVSGLATVFPTADDATVESGSTTLLQTQAFHLQPYFGLTCSDRCSRLFSTSYVAVDIDVNGNDLFTDAVMGPVAPNGLTPLGAIRDQTMLFADIQVGYWLYRDYGHIGYLNGVAPVIELHYSQPLEDPETEAVLQAPFGQRSLINLTTGLMFDFRGKASLTVYGATPLRRNEAVLAGREVTSVFDAEFGLQSVFRY